MARARALYRRSLLPLAIVASLPGPVASLAEEIDTRRFPKLVRLLLLPEEAAVLKELRDEKDRREFQRLFWARRDPSPGTATNELEDAVRAAWSPGRRLVLLPEPEGLRDGLRPGAGLLGRPEEVRKGDDAPAGVRSRAGGTGPGRARREAVRQPGLLPRGRPAVGDMGLPRPARPGVHVHPGRAPHRVRRRMPVRGGRHPRTGPAPRGGGERGPARDRPTGAAPTATSCLSPHSGARRPALSIC